jgi:hypothetical protein
VNGKQVAGRPLVLRDSDEFSPMRTRYEEDGVTVEILAGMARTPPDGTEPEDPLKADRISGWYVLCNGRAVLAADTSSVTGWGVHVPRWHGQYSGFVGVVLFSAADPAKLPMTTTKRSVDVSSAVYARALVKMSEPSRDWIDYTNARKSDLGKAKTLEQSGKQLVLPQVQERPSVRLPQLTTVRSRERVANINYAVPVKRLRKLASALGSINLSYRDVGVRSFDYAYEMLVDEDG